MDSATIQWTNSDNTKRTPPNNTNCSRFGLYNVLGTSVNLVKFLQNNSSSIVDPCISDCTFESTELQLIFSIIGSNLRSLTMSDVRLTEPAKQPIVNLLKTDMPKLQSLFLFFHGDFDFDFITTIVTADRIKTMMCHDERKTEPSDALIEFLANQRDLTVLSLYCSSKFLSKLVRFRKIKFRTKLLSLESAEKCAKCITRDLMVFIDSQRDSLVKLSLNGYVIAETVTLMRIHLKDLLMLNCRISFKRQIFAVSSTLERLEFVNIYPVDDELEAGLCQLLRSCKGLRELYLGSVIRNDAITNTITNFLPKLKSLKIEIFEHFSPPSTQMVYKISRGI